MLATHRVVLVVVYRIPPPFLSSSAILYEPTHPHMCTEAHLRSSRGGWRRPHCQSSGSANRAAPEVSGIIRRINWIVDGATGVDGNEGRSHRRRASREPWPRGSGCGGLAHGREGAESEQRITRRTFRDSNFKHGRYATAFPWPVRSGLREIANVSSQLRKTVVRRS